MAKHHDRYLANRVAGVSRGHRTFQHSPASGFLNCSACSPRDDKTGKIDGKAGLETRGAVKQVQMMTGLPADSCPTLEPGRIAAPIVTLPGIFAAWNPLFEGYF